MFWNRMIGRIGELLILKRTLFYYLDGRPNKNREDCLALLLNIRKGQNLRKEDENSNDWDGGLVFTCLVDGESVEIWVHPDGVEDAT